MDIEIPVNATQLAQKIGRSPYYIAAMKSAGYEFTHGTRTLVTDALRWLADHRDFRTTGYKINAAGFCKDDARSQRAKEQACRRMYPSA